MKPLVPLVLCLLLLPACKVEVPPIQAGFIGDSMTVDGPFTSELPPDQLTAISNWFTAHRTGWKFKVVDMPPGPALVLKHRGDRITRVELRGDTVWVGNHFKILTPEERSRVAAFFNPKNHLPVFGR
jgi:hypothetical protein